MKPTKYLIALIISMVFTKVFVISCQQKPRQPVAALALYMFVF